MTSRRLEVSKAALSSPIPTLQGSEARPRVRAPLADFVPCPEHAEPRPFIAQGKSRSHDNGADARASRVHVKTSIAIRAILVAGPDLHNDRRGRMTAIFKLL